MTRTGFAKIVFGIICLGTFLSVFAQNTPVDKHGWLQTKDQFILNEQGDKIVQLKGMSFFWSGPDNWYSGSVSDFYSRQMVQFLVRDWNCTVVRAAYAADKDNRAGWDHADRVVDEAIKQGIYVIIDWHSHWAHLDAYKNHAITFFKEKAEQYKDKPNVIFEIYNEPKMATEHETETAEKTKAKDTWDAIKPYLKEVTEAIRGTGAKNLIILGTPFYCQRIDVAAEDPLKKSDGDDYENIAYSFHFYAASHGPEAHFGGGEEHTYLKAAVERVPVFVSEWGTTHADGGQSDGHVDGDNTNWWFQNFIDKYHLGWCNWSVSNWQGSSAFAGGSLTQPSASGSEVLKYLGGEDSFDPPWIEGKEGPARDSSHTSPGTIARKVTTGTGEPMLMITASIFSNGTRRTEEKIWSAM